MMAQEFAVDQILQAVQAHLASRHVVTLATSYHDEPWAATAFYVARGLDLYVCQGKRARTLAHMLANPRDGWAREALQRAAPEFAHHFTNPDYPVLIIRVDELTFADRSGGVYPRQHLVLADGVWRLAG